MPSVPSVRAKFTCNGVKHTLSSKSVLNADGTYQKDERGHYKTEPVTLYTIEMSPVYGNGDPNHENTKFWQSSPNGTLSLGTINEEAAKSFVLGKEYYIDFTPAD